MPKEVEEKRILEIQEHIRKFKSDEMLRNQFDYILYNDYTENTVNEIIKIVEERINKNSKKIVKH